MSTFKENINLSGSFPVELAERIVNMLHNVTGGNANFMGEGGIIIATMQPERLGTVHEGAERIMAGEVDELAVSVETAEKLNGVLPGYNGVIMYEGQRLACIGLSGDPDKMRPLQKLAAIIVKEEYEKYLSTHVKGKILQKVAKEIEEMTSAIQQITAGSLESFNHSKTIEDMANDSESHLDDINKVLNTIKTIADQIKLLGLNASIEAARAGEYGRGFGVVAKEIGKLSSNSSSSLKDINSILSEIKSSITNIAEGIRNSTKIAQEQSYALQHISNSISGIQEEIEKL